MTTAEIECAPVPQDLSRNTASTRGLRRVWSGIAHLFDESHVVKLATGITCVLILIAGPQQWYVAVFACALAAGALLFPQLRGSRSVWMFLATAVGASSLLNWEGTDNHKYLLAYWCLAVGLSTDAKDQRAHLARSGRWLIAGCFVLAVYWKLRTPDFLTGDFFRMQLLLDRRFSSVTSWIAGAPLDEVRGYQSVWGALDSITDLAEFRGADIPLTARMNAVAVGMTWWTVFIESWVALAFLLPDTTRLGRLRDIPLIGFVLTTYAVATVLGFAYLLLAMALCQTRSPMARLAYVTAFFVLFLFQIPIFALSSN